MTSTEIAMASKIILGTTEAVAMYIGSTKIWELQTQPVGRLPQGYTELEYISSTVDGSLYIDLNVKLYETANSTYDLAIKFNLKGNGSDNNNQATMFSCLKDANPYPGTFIRRRNSLVQCRYIAGSSKDNFPSTLNTITELPELTPPNKNVYTSVGSDTHNWGTSLFCYFSSDSNTPARFALADLYYFKLWLNNTLIRDMIPCINPNNIVGLYDLVNNTFYSSPNGSAFEAGPIIT